MYLSIGNSYRSHLSKTEMQEHLRMISKEQPNWLVFHNIRNCTYLKIAKNDDISVIINHFENLSKQKSELLCWYVLIYTDNVCLCAFLHWIMYSKNNFNEQQYILVMKWSFKVFPILLYIFYPISLKSCHGSSNLKFLRVINKKLHDMVHWRSLEE